MRSPEVTRGQRFKKKSYRYRWLKYEAKNLKRSTQLSKTDFQAFLRIIFLDFLGPRYGDVKCEGQKMGLYLVSGWNELFWALPISFYYLGSRATLFPILAKPRRISVAKNPDKHQNFFLLFFDLYNLIIKKIFS